MWTHSSKSSLREQTTWETHLTPTHFNLTVQKQQRNEIVLFCVCKFSFVDWNPKTVMGKRKLELWEKTQIQTPSKSASHGLIHTDRQASSLGKLFLLSHANASPLTPFHWWLTQTFNQMELLFQIKQFRSVSNQIIQCIFDFFENFWICLDRACMDWSVQSYTYPCYYA